MASKLQAPTPSSFPDIDPETLTQAFRTYIAAGQNKPALASGGATNSIEYYRGMAQAIASLQNPINEVFHDNDLTQIANMGDSGLTFNVTTPILPGQWVYLVSSDTVALADCNDASTGPAIGLVTSILTQSTVKVQDFGSYTLAPNATLLVPDTLYYIGAAGNISSNPAPPVGGYLQEIGYAKTASQLIIHVREPVLI